MLFTIYKYDGDGPADVVEHVNGQSIAHAVKSRHPDFKYQAEFRKRGMPRGEIYGGVSGQLFLVRRFNPK